MEEEIRQVMRYFNFFDYSPTFTDIYTFLRKKCSQRHLVSVLTTMVRKGVVTINPKPQIPNSKQILNFNAVDSKLFGILNESNFRYTLGEYSIKTQRAKLKSQNLKFKISQRKLHNWRFTLYIKLLSSFPQIKLAGLSGSLAMMNAKEEDDIDLFIITAQNRLFTGRFIALSLAQLLGVKRKREAVRQFFIRRESHYAKSIGYSKVKRIAFYPACHKDKVCLNLFFDERALEVPKFKQTKYVAHELLQMRPIINRNHTYEKFLRANKWVCRIFPNTVRLISQIKDKKSKTQLKNKNFKFFFVVLHFAFCILNYLTDKIESILKSFQLWFIRKHQTTEIITSTQLWFFPEDFEKKIGRLD